MIDCEFSGESGKLLGAPLDPGFHHSPFRFDTETGRAEYYKPKPGGGLFAGGGTWTPFKDLEKAEITDEAFITETEYFVRELLILRTSRMVISRITGSARVIIWDMDSGIQTVYQGNCKPGKDPESLPAPKAMF